MNNFTSVICKEITMDNKEIDTHVYTIHIDENTDLRIADRRDGIHLCCQAVCAHRLCIIRRFAKASEIYYHYHITNTDTRDHIARIIDCIDGKL